MANCSSKRPPGFPFRIVLLTLVGLVIGSFGSANAQVGVSYSDEDSVFFGANVGTLLPFGITGVRDNYGGWGLWLSHPSEISQVEYGFVHVSGKGVNWYNLHLGFRIDYEVLRAVRGYFSMGANGYYYKRKRTILREFDFAPSGGIHLGFGVMQEVSKGIYARADSKFGFGPGKTLYFGVGMMWEISSGGENPSP